MEYSELPERVREEVPSPDEDPDVWQSRRLDPGQIHHDDCAVCGDTVYHLPVADGSCWVCGHHACGHNDRGETVHTEHIADPAAMEVGGYNLALKESDGDASSIMCGYCYEDFGTGNSIVVTGPSGDSWAVSYDGSVIRDKDPYGERGHQPFAEAPDWVWDVVSALVLGTGWRSTDAWRGYHATPDEAVSESEDLELSKVAGGWHSSMEQSDLSERINELNAGEFHHNGPDGLDFPVAVQFARTSNVCSIGIDIYAPEDRHDDLSDIIDSRSQPGHAGLR